MESTQRTASSLIQLQCEDIFWSLADVLFQDLLLTLKVTAASDFLWLQHAILFHSETSCSCLSHCTITHLVFVPCWGFQKVIQRDAGI